MPSRIPDALSDNGSSATSVALVFLLLMVMLSVIVQYGLNYHAHQRAAGAADRAVSVARWPDADEADGVAAGMVFLEDSDLLTDPNIDVDEGPDEVIANVHVEISPGNSLVPFATWEITAEASAPVEQFVPEPERESPSAS
ncbi:MAG: TadE/TadG family type IV pilus assembly protein [Acidimicrobiales bacterium]